MYKNLSELEDKLGSLLGNNYSGKTVSINPIDFYSSNCLGLDYVMGGGFPKGRVVEISGPESTGKSLIVSHFFADLQRKGLNCAYIDLENSLDPTFAIYCGLNTDELLYMKPDSSEQALDCCLTLINSGVVSAIAVDSVAALCSQEERAISLTEVSNTTTAKLLSMFLKKVVQPAAKTGTTLIMINQLRSTLNAKGAQEETPGGRALKYYSSIRLRLRKIDILKEVVTPVGIRVEVKNIKSKVGIPFRKAQFNLYFPHVNDEGEITAGIDTYTDFIEYGVASQLIAKKGSYFYLPDNTPFQGVKKLKKHLMQNPDLFLELKSKIEIPNYLV